MKTLNPAPKFLIYAVLKALRHPRTPITYLYCPDCRIRIPPDGMECPICHRGLGDNPQPRFDSPIPWWGSIVCIVIGIGAWVASATLNIVPLGEAARLLVYAPLGHLFGISFRRPA